MHVFKIDNIPYCSYTCHLHEVSDREEGKRKNSVRYLYNKHDMSNIESRRCKAVMKCSLDGTVIQRFASATEAAESEGVMPESIRTRAHKNTIIKNKYLWRYEA